MTRKKIVNKQTPGHIAGENYNSFIFYFWLRWVFVAACRLSLVVASRASLVEHGL